MFEKTKIHRKETEDGPFKKGQGWSIYKIEKTIWSFLHTRASNLAISLQFAQRRMRVGASVTRLGDFWKFLATNSLTKVAQKIIDFWAFWKRSIDVKTAEDIIWATFENIWATFLIQHLVTLVGDLVNGRR